MDAFLRNLFLTRIAPPPTLPLPTFALTALVTIALTITLSAAPLASHAEIAGLTVTPAPQADAKHTPTLKLIQHLIEQSHYRKRPLDDEFSEVVFDTYLERLDPARSVFLKSDIEQFEAWRYQLDDYIRANVLRPAFLIFGILRTRMDERVEYALARLSQPFDFNRNEEYQFDRADVQWANNAAQLDDVWRKRIKNDILNLRLTGKDEADIRDTLQRRYTDMARRIRQFKSEDVFQIFVNAFANGIEPHTSYFSPRASENFRIQMRLSLEGIGATLRTDNEYTQVVNIIPGGPADLGQALKADDRIIGVAQDTEEIVDVIGWRLGDVVALIRGPAASVVRLEILPGENGLNGKSEVISIVRDKINLEEQAAKKRTITIETPHGKSTLGVIDLPSFYVDFEGQRKNLPDYRSTTRDIRKLIGEFKAGAIDGLIIDLRGNGGGSLAEAVSLTGLFIKQGPVVQVRDAGGDVNINQDTDSSISYTGPLAVLVDRHSASASEIFAAAIQDYRRGLVIGELTYGKGTVQHLVELSRYVKDQGDLGRLKITVAQFFRINGDSTQHRGVIPDIIWPNTSNDAEYGERIYDNAIPWRRLNRATFTPARTQSTATAFAHTVRQHEARVRISPDFQYFMEVNGLNNQRSGRQFVSLDESTRQQERMDYDALQLELENRRRRALGKDTVASVEALDLEKKEITEAEADGAEPAVDAFLRESGNILVDYFRATAAHNSQTDSQVGATTD